MALTSPLDKIPKIPPQLTSLIVDAIVAYINSIIENLMITLAEAVKLPDNIQCDDPRIKKIEEQLTKIQELILKLQEFIPYIEKALSAIQTAVTLANSIKAIQLLNPVTAIPVLAAELVLAQNLTIANALTSVEQLKTIPQKLNLNIDLIASKLGEIYGRLGQACTDKEYEVAPEVKKSIDQMQQFDINVNPDGGLPSEFYREVNVSTDDIEQRLELIKQLIDSQQDLFESLQEAPAQSFNGTTPPEVDLGKSGDYFIDTAAKKIYGPKTINEQKKQSITETFNNRPKKRKVQFKENKFSDILNDTDGLTEPNSKSNYAQLMTEDIVMTSADANAFGVQRKMQSSNSTPTVVDAETGQHINVDPVTAKAMTRDYSSLMKAIDKRKGFS